MGLNLSVVKRYSLEGFAEGWTDDTYLRVLGSSSAEAKGWTDTGVLDGENETSGMKDILKEKVLGGAVLNTNEDGTTEIKQFGKEDVADVLDALPNATLLEVFETSLGLRKHSSTS